MPTLAIRKGADRRYSLRPLVRPLEALLATPITFLPQPVSALTRQDLEALPAGAIALAENLRFTEAEKATMQILPNTLLPSATFIFWTLFQSAIARTPPLSESQSTCPPLQAWLWHRKSKLCALYWGDSQETSAPLKGSLAIVGGAKISTKLPLLNAFAPTL